MKCKIEDMGFSFFRITLGAYILIAGWNKLGGLIATGFDPEQFGLLKHFMEQFYGENATIVPWLQIFFPKFVLIGFTWIVPFWEFIAGGLLFIGLFRKYAVVAILLLLCIFGIGTEASNYPQGQNIWVFVNLIAYYLVYKGLQKDSKDILSLDNYINKFTR
ncbi:MAG: hypothetical protein LBH40_03970 [Alphaproteobacteria bacterium]|jgi:uncharacterized membrane protein YphA (DoxX/SURF4 family)|nr:hypothetical protein [Alphaproteobacteria bacterium]